MTLNSNNSGMFLRKEMGVIIALVILVIFFSVTSDVFLTSKNWLNILRQISLLGIMSVGMTNVIVSGEFDLSVGSTFGMSAMLTATFMSSGLPVWLSITLGLTTGFAVGLANGLLVTYIRIPSFIVTLGMLNIARGIALVVTNGLVVVLDEHTVADANNLQLFFQYGGGGKVGGNVPIMIFYFVIVAIVGYLLLHKTMIGFRMKAVGGNANAARVVGINVNVVKITAFAILGVLSALAGIINLAFITNAQGTTGQGMELSVIAATVIGGTSITGGEGSIIGTVVGVLIMGVLNNGLVLVGVSTFVQTICIGGVIIGAVAIDIWTKRNK